MKMKMKRFLALILVVALCASMLVFSAPSAGAITFNALLDIVQYYIEIVKIADKYVDPYLAKMTGFKFEDTGEVAGRFLDKAEIQYNDAHIKTLNELKAEYGVPITQIIGKDISQHMFGDIAYDAEMDAYRVRDKSTGAFVVDANGEFPYCPADVYEAYNRAGEGAQPDPEYETDYLWLSRDEVSSDVFIVTESVVGELAIKHGLETGHNIDVGQFHVAGADFKCVTMLMEDNSPDRLYLCTKNRQLIGYPLEPSAANTERNPIAEDGTLIDVDGLVYDIAAGILNVILPDGTVQPQQVVGSVYNDNSTNYTVETCVVNFNETKNYYEYNYYTYNIAYTYNNTYITYLGSNAAYEPEEYEFYYQLPDGRSSADLTAADISGLSFQFHDVVNYAKSAEDTSLRALYHFDGDTDDSSYFSTQTSFEWETNASITYMDSGVFEGALYMDEQDHEFHITLPSNIGSGDFTYQWRYYHNAAEVTTAHRDNYIYLGDTPVFSWAENYIYNANGELIGVCNNGSWQEFALIRNNGVMYYYHNGLCVGQLTDNRAYANQIRFVLGDTSRAYSMVDEMRVLNYAHAVAGSDYRCTTVPYDTNAVLVLPDGAFPIADEYWQFNTEGNRLVQYDFTTGEEFYPIGSTQRVSTRYYESGVIDYTVGYYGNMSSPYTSVSYFDGHMTVTGEKAFSGTQTYDGSLVPYYGLVTSLARSHVNGYFETSSRGLIRKGDENKPFTFSVLDAQENLYSITFSVTFNANNDAKSVEFDWGYLQINTRDNNGIRYFVSIVPKQGKSIDIVYMELVEGETPNSGHELVKCIYSSEEVKPNTAAIQTDIPVAGYTVGGVRPTLPARGDLWFPVEGNRITAAYIYTGSAWQAVNVRWYTGTRWIPIYAFDIVTLKDMWDIADADDVVSSITSEYGFWNWWKAQWLDFRAWLESVLGSGTVTTPGGTVDKEDLPSVPGTPNEDGEEEGGWSIIELLVLLKDGTWRIVTGVVTTGFESITGFAQGISSIGDYFDAYDTNNPDGITGIYTYEGADIWD